jgi:hypothetical protein
MAQPARFARRGRSRPQPPAAESDVSIAFGAAFAGACAIGWLVGVNVAWELLAILGVLAALSFAIEAAIHSAPRSGFRRWPARPAPAATTGPAASADRQTGAHHEHAR